MDETKQNDTEDRKPGRSTRMVETVRGQIDGYGEPRKYSYTMVYTQKSVRLLDLRFDSTELRDIELLWRILGAHWRGAGYNDDEVFIEIDGQVYMAESATKTLESKS